MAGPVPGLGEDLGHDRGRQGDPGHPRGVRRAPEGRVGRLAPGGEPGGRRPEPHEWADALPGRQHGRAPPRRGDAGRRSFGTGGPPPALGLPWPLFPGPGVRRDPGLGGPPRCHCGGGVHAGHPPPLGHAVLARDPLRAHRAPCRGRGRSPPPEPRAALAAPPGAHPRRGRLPAVCRRVRGVAGPAYPAGRGLSGLGGLRGRADRVGGRPHPHARLRDLLRVRAGGGSGNRGAASAHGGRRRAGASLRGGDEHAGRTLVVRARRHGPVHRAGIRCGS